MEKTIETPLVGRQISRTLRSLPISPRIAPCAPAR